MSEENPNTELRRLVRAIDEDGKGLTDWEVNFISEMIDRDVRHFSSKQADKIRKIYDERVKT